jgi:hypothetical protein
MHVLTYKSHVLLQTCWGGVNGTCTASPRFTEILPWGTSPGLELGSETGSDVLPAIYNHRMARINLTAYAFGGIDGKHSLNSYAVKCLMTSNPPEFCLLFHVH